MRYFSIFSGIGGFEYGMDQSDYEFECVGYSEINKYARSIYEKHYPNHINFGDATKINTDELPNFDFLVGGFPCQAFSIAGKRGGFNDTRGTLFFEIARILRDKSPRYFLLENVKGLLSHDNGRTFKTILEICDELGYDVSWQVYNSKYYGVPQNRERVFIKGYFRDKCGREIFSFRQNKEDNTRVMNGRCVVNGSAYYYPSSDTLCACITEGGKHSGGRNFVNVSDGNEYLIRKLTPVECERLQAFPDDWTKWGKDGELISDTQRYKCCGNAVTTSVITFIINNMFR